MSIEAEKQRLSTLYYKKRFSELSEIQRIRVEKHASVFSVTMKQKTPEEMAEAHKRVVFKMLAEEEKNTEPRGLGDTIAKIASALGFQKKKGCGCSARQKALNKMFPYRKAK